MKVLLSIAILLLESAPVQTPTGGVEGRVRLKEGSPASGVRVSAVAPPVANPVLELPAGTIVTSVLTDSSGHYRLEEVPPGRYYIRAGLIEFPTYYPGVRDAGDGQVILVTAGSLAKDIDFTMTVPVGVRVSGRLTGWPGSAAAALPIQLVLRNSSSSIASTIKPDGLFEFLGVPPGSYVLSTLISPVAASSAFGSLPGYGGVPTLSRVLVLDQDITGISMEFPALVTGNVVVIVDGGISVPTFNLSFSGDAGRHVFTTQPDGKFPVALPAGEYRVALSALPAAYYLKSIVSGKRSLLGEPLKLSGGPVEIVVTLGVHPAKGVRP